MKLALHYLYLEYYTTGIGCIVFSLAVGNLPNSFSPSKGTAQKNWLIRCFRQKEIFFRELLKVLPWLESKDLTKKFQKYHIFKPQLEQFQLYETCNVDESRMSAL